MPKKKFVKNKKNKKFFVKKGDTVMILSGDDKKKTGVVLAVFHKTGTVIVSGVNLVEKNVRRQQGEEKGHREKKEMPISISKVVVVEKQNNVPTRIGRKKDEKGKFQRFSRKTGNFI